MKNTQKRNKGDNSDKSCLEAVSRTGDTIFSECTPHGRAGVSMIRVSGPDAYCVAASIFNSADTLWKSFNSENSRFEMPRKFVCFGTFIDKSPETVYRFDDGIAICYRAPNSYTGDDTIELCCHGNPLIVKKILDILGFSGARHALPGEFTERAFLNGKMSLLSAEAVHSLIEADTTERLEDSFAQLSGGLQKVINRLKDDIMELMVQVEAILDFPDDMQDMEDIDNIGRGLYQTGEYLKKLRQDSESRHSAGTSRPIVIAGAPNTGKSTLFNALLGQEKAITSAEKGTTRDIISGQSVIGGITVEIADTAGLRSTESQVEGEGVRRAVSLCENAALVLWTIDGSRPWSESMGISGMPPGKNIIMVICKSDLKQVAEIPSEDIDVKGRCAVSALEHEGLDRLRSLIYRFGVQDRGSAAVTGIATHRAVEGIRRASEKIEDAITCFSEDAFDMLAECLRDICNDLEDIIGPVNTEELIDSIFRRFCLGK